MPEDHDPCRPVLNDRDPMPSRVSREYWDGVYDRQASTSAMSPTPIQSVLKKRLAYFQLDKLFRLFMPEGPGRSFLEFGCGGSFWLPYFYRVLNYTVEGIDYSQSGCDRAHAQLRRFDTEGKIHLLDFRKMKSSFDGRFDVCGSFGVIEHFDRPGDQVRQFGRCLKPGGFLITTIPWLKGFQGFVQRTFNRSVYDHHQILSLEDLVSFHTQAGLMIRHAGYLGLTTLDRNFGTGIIGHLYGGYNGAMNRAAVGLEKMCRRGLPVFRGSGCVVIAQHP